MQPFGGEGLSGTGPKAGGPLYLKRLAATAAARVPSDERAATLPTAPTPPTTRPPARPTPDPALLAALAARGSDGAAVVDPDAYLDRCLGALAALARRALPGPTGETNTLAFVARDTIACRAARDDDLLAQAIAVLALGRRPRLRIDRLPSALRTFADDWDEDVDRLPRLDALLVALPGDALSRTKEAIAARPGPLVAVVPWTVDTEPASTLWRLVRERCETVNTAAAGGNASLMTLGEP